MTITGQKRKRLLPALLLGVLMLAVLLILPQLSKMGTDILSANLLLEDASEPIVWRGPMIANLVQQFWTDTYWKDVDYMFVDMPPGTGDVPLTVFQSLPVDGILIVTSPQELVSMIVGKAVRMAQMMNIPIIGIVENMSYVVCPDCGKQIKVFGESHIDEIAEKAGVKVIAKLPINPEFSRLSDTGMIERAAALYRIDLSASWFVGDMTMDVECGKRAGLKTVLLSTGWPTISRRSWRKSWKLSSPEGIRTPV